MTFRWLTELMVRTWTNIEEPGKMERRGMKILAEIPLRKGFESERFQVSTALFQHVNELRAGSKVPGFQRCSSGFWAWPKQCITPRPRD